MSACSRPSPSEDRSFYQPPRRAKSMLILEGAVDLAQAVSLAFKGAKEVRLHSLAWGACMGSTCTGALHTGSTACTALRPTEPLHQRPSDGLLTPTPISPLLLSSEQDLASGRDPASRPASATWRSLITGGGAVAVGTAGRGSTGGSTGSGRSTPTVSRQGAQQLPPVEGAGPPARTRGESMPAIQVDPQVGGHSSSSSSFPPPPPLAL